MIMKKKIFAALLLCLFLGNIFAQENINNQRRATYIYEFIRQINWPGESSLKSLKVGIVDNNSDLSTEIRSKAVELGNIRNKPLEVITLKSLKELPALQVIYVNKQWMPQANIDSLMKALDKKNTLVITEAAQFQQSMINFIVVNDQMRYELNEAALQKQGFTYSRVLPFAAIKTKEDWETLFMATKQELEEEKVVTSRQKQEIEEQEQEIAQQAEEIAIQNTEIKRQQKEIAQQQTRLSNLSANISAKQKELNEQNVEIQQQEQLIGSKQKEIEKQTQINAEINEEIAVKQTQIGDLSTRINEQLAKLKMQNVIIILGGLLLVFLAIFGWYAYRNYKQKQRTNQILEAKNTEIEKQNVVLLDQRNRIARQNKEITDSIISAERIQKAILPKRYVLEDIIDMFIFYRPRDIVSGDFYWMSKKEDKLIIVAADCTGHGVPGAFMSMLGVAFLNEIVSNETDVYANNILNKLREHIIKSLNQAGKKGNEAKEGMDMALCVIDYPSMTLQYAGAYNPLIMIRENQLQEIKADKMPVAYYEYGKEEFTNNMVKLAPGDCFYMFSDGYADQFGGSKQKKFSSKRLKDKLLEIHQLPIKDQEQMIATIYDEWKGTHDQVDDVLLIGIKM